MSRIMSDGESSLSLVSQSQIYGWRHRVREIDGETRALAAERAKLERLIAMAEELEREAHLLDEASQVGPSQSKMITRALGELKPTDNFPTAVSLVVERSEDGATYEDIREAILQSPLGNKLRKSDKGFYHALARGKQKGSLVEYNGFIFTPEHLKTFRKKVAAGIKEDRAVAPALGSPLMDALMETIAKNPGIIAKEVIAAIRGAKDRQGRELIKNEGSAYNAIARLKQRGEIEGFGYQDRQLRIGPEAPEHLRRLARAGIVVPLAKKNTAASK